LLININFSFTGLRGSRSCVKDISVAVEFSRTQVFYASRIEAHTRLGYSLARLQRLVCCPDISVPEAKDIKHEPVG
jgi:hypothetical protein